MKALPYLIHKEVLQFKRNPFLPRLVIMFPLMLMLVMPWVTTLEVNNVNVTLIDNDHSSASRRLISQLKASSYFSLTNVASSYEEAYKNVEASKADIIFSIPANFEKDMVNGKDVTLQINANSVNGTKGSLGSSYLSQIVNDFLTEMRSGNVAPKATGGFTIRYFYNPTLNYRHYMVPALMIIVILMLCGALPALNIVGEKEKGTIEQLNVTPISRTEFILAKLIPYWIMGLVLLTLCFFIAWLVYGLVPAGSYTSLYLGALLFIFVMSGLGLIISNYSSNMLQAMLLMFFIILICNLMSGIFTPISSMPHWAQMMTYIIFPHYFVEIMRGVYLQGNTIPELWTNYVTLFLFAVVFNSWAIMSYKKQV
ncbi:MAG TPA: ABC transporter permease [Paludibacteraceae bacterium]|nr:ABC transporter permease [Paludibacteraceae bacterium]HQF50357.1 ABC transporter permease [Paludibacteraceae bacterium]HQJ89233.1 ABC transporter permease [Paludibacteraceae bacterium]